MSAPLVAQAAIQIHAPVAVIWAILLDLAAYKEWNPFIVEVTDICPPGQPIAVEAQFTLHCEYSDGTNTTSREAVKEVTPPGDDGNLTKAVLAYGFAGPVADAGLLSATRYQWLEQDSVAGGPTRYRTEDTFTGPAAVLVPVAQVQDGFERMAAALKLRAESMSN